MATPISMHNNIYSPPKSIPVAISIRCINCARCKMNYTPYNSCFPKSISQATYNLLSLCDNHFAFNKPSGGGLCDYTDMKTRMEFVGAYPTCEYGKIQFNIDFVRHLLGSYGLTEQNGVFVWTQPHHAQNVMPNHYRMSVEWRDEVCKEVLSGIDSDGRSSIEEAVTNAYKVISKTKGKKKDKKRGTETRIFGLERAEGGKRGRWLHRPVTMERLGDDKENDEDKDGMKIDDEEKILEDCTNNNKGETSCGKEDRKVGEISTNRNEKKEKIAKVNKGDEHEPKNKKEKLNQVEGKSEALSLSISPETSSAFSTCKRAKIVSSKNPQHFSKDYNETTNQDETSPSGRLQDNKTSSDFTATIDKTTTLTPQKAATTSITKEHEPTTKILSKSSSQPIDEDDSTIAVFTRYCKEYTPLSFVISYNSLTKPKSSSTPSVRYISVSSKINSSLLSDYYSQLVKNICLFEESSKGGQQSKVGLCSAYCLGGSEATQTGEQENRKKLENYRNIDGEKVTHLEGPSDGDAATTRSQYSNQIVTPLKDTASPQKQISMTPLSNNAVNQFNKYIYKPPTPAAIHHTKGLSKFYLQRLSDLHIGYSQIAHHLSNCIPNFQPPSISHESDVGLKELCERTVNVFNLSESISGVVMSKSRVDCIESESDKFQV